MDFSQFEAKANELDQLDTLAHFRSQFSSNNYIYLDGNSLGKLPLKTIELQTQLIENQWGAKGIQSWNEHWLDLQKRLSEKIAKLVGAQVDEIFVGDNTSVNLFKLAFAALTFKSDKTEIVSDEHNFPGDLYVLDGLVRQHFKSHTLTIAKSIDEIAVNENEIGQLINKKTALLSLSAVLYKSAYSYPMEAVNALAHEHGALTLWDLSHAVGAIPIHLDKSNTDLAVGCTYKYLNGGPGAPAFLFIRKSLQPFLQNPISAWFGHNAPFQFKSTFEANTTIQKMATGTPNILSLAAIEPGLDIHLNAGIENIYQKSQLMSNFCLKMMQEVLLPLGFEIGSPLDSDKRGSHISIKHKEGYRISQALIQPKLAGAVKIIPDFRPPNHIRLGFAPLYNTFSEISQTIKRIVQIVENQEYSRFDTRIIGVS